MARTILLIGTLNTKEREFRYARELIVKRSLR